MASEYAGVVWPAVQRGGKGVGKRVAWCSGTAEPMSAVGAQSPGGSLHRCPAHPLALCPAVRAAKLMQSVRSASSTGPARPACGAGAAAAAPGGGGGVPEQGAGGEDEGVA